MLKEISETTRGEEEDIALAVETHKKLLVSNDLSVPRIVLDFLCFTWHTVPYRDEEKYLGHLRPEECEVKEWGWEAHIGTSETMFTCHLDTVGGSVKVTHGFASNNRYVTSCNKSVLGSDDKAGTAIMLEMMRNKVPGHYYFFYGEESGGIGSRLLADRHPEDMKLYKRCVSFDRRGYGSIITKQGGSVCCSDEFGNALSNQLAGQGMFLGLDTGGLFTDSANFKQLIPECTNLSVGSFNQHQHTEYQDILFMSYLARACSAIDWESLPVHRKIVVYTPSKVSKYGKWNRYDDGDYYGYGQGSLYGNYDYEYPENPTDEDYTHTYSVGCKWDNFKGAYLKPIDKPKVKTRHIPTSFDQDTRTWTGGYLLYYTDDKYVDPEDNLQYPLFYRMKSTWDKETRRYTNEKIYCDGEGIEIDVDVCEIISATAVKPTGYTNGAIKLETMVSDLMAEVKLLNVSTAELKKAAKPIIQAIKKETTYPNDYIPTAHTQFLADVAELEDAYDVYSQLAEDVLSSWFEVKNALKSCGDDVKKSYKRHVQKAIRALLDAQTMSDTLFDAGIIYAKDVLSIKVWVQNDDTI